MYLKRIQLAGFKSFVDPTTFLIQGNISAVVGPNGCGKSNVVDALRWVIGETSAKQLRGQSMQDVIFNGTVSRKPVSKASVELLFDNEQGKMGGEYANYTEISVRREIEQDGQSSYFINGVHVRRRDVIDLFLGTGLGAYSYAIVEQGVISHFIEAKPEELRVFVEEAAGISKYKERRREAEQRMQHTYENLERLNDIRTELGKQLRHIKRQAEVAQKYQQDKDIEQRLISQIKVLEWNQLEEKRLSDKTLLITQETAWEEKRSEHSQLEVEVERFKEIVQNKLQTQNELQTAYYELNTKIARLEQAIVDQEKHLEQNQQDIFSLDQQLQALKHTSRENEERLEGWLAEKSKLAISCDKSRMEVVHAQDILDQREQDMQMAQTRWETAKDTTAQLSRQQDVLKTKLEHLLSQQKDLFSHHGSCKQALKELPLDALKNTVERLQREVEGLDCALGESQQQLEQCANSLVNQRQLNQNARITCQETQRHLQKIEAECISLAALQKAATDTRCSLEWIKKYNLEDASRLGAGLHVNAGWELAVETVLGHMFDALCVEPSEAWASALGELESGRVTLLSKEKVTHFSPAGKPETLINQIQSEWPVHQWLSYIYVAPDVTTALALRSNLEPMESVITPQGLWMGPNWIRVVRGDDPQSGFLSRRKELQSLEQQKEDCLQKLANEEMLLQQGEITLQSLEQQREVLNTKHQQCLATRAEVQSHLTIEKKNLEHTFQQETDLKKAVNDTEHQSEKLAKTISDLRSQVAQVEEKLQTEWVQLEAFQTVRDTFREELRQDRERCHQQRESVDMESVRLSEIDNQIASLQQTIAHEVGKKQNLQLRREQLCVLVSDRTALSELRTELQGLLAERIVLDTECQTAKQNVQDQQAQLKELDQQHQAIGKWISSTRDQLEQLRLELHSVASKQLSLQEMFPEGMEWEVVRSELADQTLVLPEVHKELSLVLNRIKQAGAVNLAAIEEHQALEERFSYLENQYRDLSEALTLLQGVIDKIDQESMEKFRETFKKLNDHFQGLFPKIFGGGQASLELTEADWLKAGLLVRAQPPGKRNSTIHLLSGGEKALTAIALVFSLFHLNPAPFCVLDEVDAPLDDMNVNRFCQLLKVMSKDVQFIVISHNKSTIASADSLMGVTMQEPGISRLVSVDIQAALEMVQD